ncbi:MAG TPA: SH3 domain-containing protein [Roseiflexaceae bacterium]|nr:SH3 domain-containing protein [Roseiflexaceae bacterium]
MIEQSPRRWAPGSQADLEALQLRASRQRARHKQTIRTVVGNWHRLRDRVGSSSSVARLPSRIILHALVVLLLPLAIGLSSLPPGTLTQQIPVVAPSGNGDFVVPMVPLSIGNDAEFGDAPLEDNGEIPIPLSLVSRSEALAPVVVSAQVAAERIFMRSGPSTQYDAIGRISRGAELQVIGRYGDWFQVRERIDGPVYWLSGELLDIPEHAIYTLFEVQQEALPALPPPKVASVREDGLQLRDGPGTNYVPMVSLKANTQLELIETYQDWYHVGTADGLDGWVKGEFLTVESAIAERLLAAEAIPDPNPALVGVINENKVNLRRGPDSRYSRVGMIDASTQVQLIGKHKDWLRVQLADGTKAWIFSDFVNTTSHVVRRVPQSRDFPALPVASAGRPGASPNLGNIPASGDVASLAVQYVGYRYVWGGASPSRGFDCSGLTSYVYKQFGVSLPRTAASQFSTAYGASVGPMENLAPGDLMFFVNTGGRRGISHVSIYIGGGRMVHAMTPRYGVQVSSVWGSYWTSRYAGAIRVRR